MKVMAVTLATLASLAVLGCSSTPNACLDESNCTDGVPPGPNPGTNPSQVAPLCADTGVSHVGLGGKELTVSRVAAKAGADRGRSKPYSALRTEYGRVLGSKNTPSLLASTGSTFGEPDARWFQEPQAGAVSLYTAFRVAYDGCLQVTGAVDNQNGKTEGDAKYGIAPTADTAKGECEAWAKKFWSRAPTPQEVQGCVDVALVDSVKEEKAPGKFEDTPPKKRWAYACASVLSATGFLAY